MKKKDQLKGAKKYLVFRSHAPAEVPVVVALRKYHKVDPETTDIIGQLEDGRLINLGRMNGLEIYPGSCKERFKEIDKEIERLEESIEDRILKLREEKQDKLIWKHPLLFSDLKDDVRMEKFVAKRRTTVEGGGYV